MSLFLFQQKIPFGSVISHLRLFEPGCKSEPSDWATVQVQDVAVGDFVFCFEPVYSPWNDSAAGIGVAEGDSFNVSSIAIVHKWDNGPWCYIITPESYHRQQLQLYLTQQCTAAKASGSGFYYTIARPSAGLNQAAIRDIAELDRSLDSGWRQDDNQPIDILYRYFAAAGFGLPVHPRQCPDIAQIGYIIFCDKELSDPAVPDLRPFVQPLPNDQRLLPGAESSPSQPAGETPQAVQRSETPQVVQLNETPPVVQPVEAPASGSPAKQGQVPRMPSFFSQFGKRGSAHGKGLFGPGSDSAPPPMAAIDLELPAAESSMPAAEAQLPPQQWTSAAPAQELPPDLSGYSMPLPEQESSPWAAAESSPPPREFVPPAKLMPLPEPGAVSQDQSGDLPVPGQVNPGQEGQPVAQPFGHAASQAGSRAPLPPIPAAQSTPDIKALAGLLGNIGRTASAPLPQPSSALSQSGALTDQPTNPASSLSKPDKHETGTDPLPERLLPPPLPHAAAVQPAKPQLPPPLPGAQKPAAASGRLASPTAAPRDLQAPWSSPPVNAPMTAQTFDQSASPVAAPAATPPALPHQPAISQVASAAAANVEKTADTGSLKPDIAYSVIASTLPPKKQLAVSDEHPGKEPAAVRSGVAGLVSKLEQQANKAASRLEAQVDEIQGRLTDELSKVLAKVTATESRGARNAQDLCADITEKLEAATVRVSAEIVAAARQGAITVNGAQASGAKLLEEQQEHLTGALTSSFEEVRQKAQAAAKSFDDQLSLLAGGQLDDLDKLSTLLTIEVSGLFRQYEGQLQESFDSFRQRLESTDSSITGTVEARFTLFQGQLAERHKRWQDKLLQTRRTLVGQLSKQYATARTDVSRLQASALEESILPRLSQHREELRSIIEEFQQKLADDLASKSEEKLSEFDPILSAKRKELVELQDSTATIKDVIEEKLRCQLQEMADGHRLFVEKGIESAQTPYRLTEEKLADIDRAARLLADQSSVEGDLGLLTERDTLLAKMDKSTEGTKEEVLGTLRTSLAALEEKGKQLQEELISSMEEDAYRVRRASDQALIAIREAIKESFIAIQTAQDERMPM